ncbi:hypothetical protein CTAYLR_002296 [Chrysophaeum taylorii]|uniref:Uncharacterized protein n=1 Tax=Chrysophaeum taylorii TaxID=2483200 RepID=A0AAD7XRK9_9STRA|nr:hypothetical protein CTAYLR_002296 [Chrysophaeum taylorii]
MSDSIQMGAKPTEADAWKLTKAESGPDDETVRAARALEQDFAIAVFEIGLRQSSPKVLKGLMRVFRVAVGIRIVRFRFVFSVQRFGSLTTEHIKSHLQKYRLHYERSKEEFLGHYRKYLRLDRGDVSRDKKKKEETHLTTTTTQGFVRLGDEDDDNSDRPRAPATAPSASLRDDDESEAEWSSKQLPSITGKSLAGAGASRQLLARGEREIAQLVRVQSVHNQLVHEQLELQNTLQAQMHEQLHLQAELNALMRDAATLPVFAGSEGTATEPPSAQQTS